MPTKRRLRHRSAVIGAAATLVLGLSSGAHAASTGTTATTTTTTTAMDTTAAHTVTYDGYSFLIDGKRTYLWSGEFHYFRLPNQDLWRDVLEKMKAAGFNAISLYFDWGYHSPAPGRLRLHRRTRRRQTPRHRAPVRHLRHRSARPVHQCRGRRRRLPRLAAPPRPATPAPTTPNT